jgi:hypothetical protein
MISWRFIFRKYRLDNVFTPSTIAKLTYVQRSTCENDVDKFLTIPGMQIVYMAIRAVVIYTYLQQTGEPSYRIY